MLQQATSFLVNAFETLNKTISTIVSIFIYLFLFSNSTPPTSQTEQASTPQPTTISQPLLDIETPSPPPTVTQSPTFSQNNPTPTTTIPGSENFQIEPDPDGKDGFYIMKSTLNEDMSTSHELNQAVNQYRQTHNLNTLFIDPQLCEIANQRAQEIESDFSHDQFSQHVDAGDYTYTGFKAIGENLWRGQFSGVHIVEFGWDRTIGHRANLQGDWSRGCAGIYLTNAVFIFVK